MTRTRWSGSGSIRARVSANDSSPAAGSIGTSIELPGVDFLFEKRVQGSNMGSNQFRVDMPRYVDFYLSGRLKLDELVSARIGLGDINEAFDNLRSGELARSVVIFD